MNMEEMDRFLAATTLSGFVWVQVWLEGDKLTAPSRQMLVKRVDVGRLYTAFYRLHVEPGIGPSGRKTALMKRFISAEIGVSGPCWWSTPNLGRPEEFDDSREGVPVVKPITRGPTVYYEVDDFMDRSR